MIDYTVNEHFEGKDPVVRETYKRMLKAARKLGPIGEESKKTSIHLVCKSAMAGVATRKSHLVLTIKSDHALSSPRVHKAEQVSANRFHNEIKLASPAEVDAELIGWLKAAYRLSS